MDAFRLRHEPFGYGLGYSNSPATRTPSGYTGSVQGSPVFSRGQISPQDRAPSATTTPLSSFSNPIANPIHYPMQPLPFPSPIPSTPLDKGVFRPYNPTKMKRGGASFSKSCVPCHLRKRKCLPKSGTSTCDACSGKALYCRGVISIVNFVDIAQWSQQTVESFKIQCEALASVANTCLTVELSVHANSEIHKGVSDHGAISADLAESYEVRLEAGLFPRSEEARQKMARILDLVLPTLKRPTARGDTSEHLNLAEYETCCRRLIASIAILGHPSASSLDWKTWENRSAPFIVLGFMAHVGEEIRSLIGDLATRLNQFLWAPRNSRYFASRVWMVAFGLGRVYSAVESANNAWRVQYQVVPFLGNIFSNADALLMQIRSIGCGLYKDSFQLGTGDETPQFMGVRLQLYDPLRIGSAPWSRSTQISERPFDTFENILSQCCHWPRRTPSCYRSKATVTFHLEAESSDDDSTPDSDILDKGMGSPIFEGSYTPYTTEQRNALLSDMKQEILQLQDQVRDKQKKREEIAHQVAEDQVRIEQLQASIDLAILCELPADSPNQSNLASPMPARLHTPSLVPDIHPNFAGKNSPACPSPDLTFSPSDQTLVEMGQIAAVKGAELAPTQHEDVMILTVKDSAAASPESSESCNSDSRTSNRSLRPSPHHEMISSRKRRRLSGLFSAEFPTDASSTLAITPQSIPLASEPIGEQVSSEKSCSPGTLHGRSRRSQQLSALPPALEHVGTRKSDSPRTDTTRPVSFPQSQRWRKSLGVSVKTLTEGFERMRLKQRDNKTSQPT